MAVSAGTAPSGRVISTRETSTLPFVGERTCFFFALMLPPVMVTLPSLPEAPLPTSSPRLLDAVIVPPEISTVPAPMSPPPMAAPFSLAVAFTMPPEISTVPLPLLPPPMADAYPETVAFT